MLAGAARDNHASPGRSKNHSEVGQNVSRPTIRENGDTWSVYRGLSLN